MLNTPYLGFFLSKLQGNLLHSIIFIFKKNNNNNIQTITIWLQTSILNFVFTLIVLNFVLLFFPWIDNTTYYKYADNYTQLHAWKRKNTNKTINIVFLFLKKKHWRIGIKIITSKTSNLQSTKEQYYMTQLT